MSLTMAEDATKRRLEIMEIDAAKGPTMATPAKSGGIVAVMVRGMI